MRGEGGRQTKDGGGGEIEPGILFEGGDATIKKRTHLSQGNPGITNLRNSIKALSSTEANSKKQ
jgi:hypothetical protein